ncbi:MAG: hypothetical protein JWL77_2038 [Chthonomonadaceae bacterium]|nr:hypothetical protein [Chthonomonadaceae bacterium]
MLHLTQAQLQMRRIVGPLAPQWERHLAFCRRCQARAAAIRSRFRLPALLAWRRRFYRSDGLELIASPAGTIASGAIAAERSAPPGARKLLPGMGIRAGGIVVIRRAIERIETEKRRLDYTAVRFLGALEARLAPDQMVLVRYRPPIALFDRAPVWERSVEISLGPLRLQMHGVQIGAGMLFYARVGFRSPHSSEQEGEAFLSRPGLELTLISADGPVRSATISRRGQAIFHLLPGIFSLLLPPRGWELRIVWHPRDPTSPRQA